MAAVDHRLLLLTTDFHSVRLFFELHIAAVSMLARKMIWIRYKTFTMNRPVSRRHPCPRPVHACLLLLPFQGWARSLL